MATRSLSRSCSQLTRCHSKSAAGVFLQLAPSRRQYSNVAPSPVLEFLLPPPSRYSFVQHTRSVKLQKQGRRSFTISSVRQQTKAIHNPQKDEDGNEMLVEITPRASNRLKDIMSKDGNPNLALRIQVESGGCHGFQYLMSLTTLPPLSSAPQQGSPALNTSSSNPNAMPSVQGKNTGNSSLREDDTVFESTDGAGARVVMDGPSLDLLKGSKVDFTMELIGSQFKIVDNPLATSSCGCGTSFDIKA